MKRDGYFLMHGVIIVFQVGLALLRYREDDLICFLTLIDCGLEALFFKKENNMFTLMINL